MLVFLPGQLLHAQTVVRTGESVSIASDQLIAGDFYTAASILDISGEVSGDVLALSGQVTLNGTMSSDVLVVGGNVDIHGSVGDDLRILGGEVVIAEPVAGDVFVMGGTVRILSTATIGGDVLVYGGDVEISGPVAGDVLGRMNSLRIDGPIAGDVTVSAVALVLGERAAVSGSVQYESVDVLTRSQSASVTGEVTRNDPVFDDSSNNLQSAYVPVLVLLFSVLVWYMIGRTLLQKIVDRALVKSVRPALLGFITLLSAPLIIVILSVSVLGTLVGITAFFAYMLAILLSLISVSALFGQLLMNLYKGAPKKITPLTLVAGVIGINIVVLVPILGAVVIVGLTLITLGALIDIVLRP